MLRINMLKVSIGAILAMTLGIPLNQNVKEVDAVQRNTIMRTVIFDTDGGSPVDAVEVEHAYLLKKPSDPIKPGYKFMGWFQEGWEIPFGFNYTTIMKDITLVARWEKIDPETILRTVTFDTNGGSAIDSVEVKHAYLLKEPPAPTRIGYKFAGWYQEGWEIPFGFNYTTIMKDITLVARWEKIDPETILRTVTFDTNGGSAIDSVEVKHAYLLKEPPAPTRIGYKFAGWYQEGWEIPFGFNYTTILTDITLVARWEKIDPETILRIVTFDTNGGSAIDPVEVKHAYLLKEPVAPTRIGYKFMGWYQEGWEIPFGFSYTTILEDITLVAKWEKLLFVDDAEEHLNNKEDIESLDNSVALKEPKLKKDKIEPTTVEVQSEKINEEPIKTVNTSVQTNEKILYTVILLSVASIVLFGSDGVAYLKQKCSKK